MLLGIMRVDALGAVHRLGDIEIDRHAAQRVGVFARKMFFGDQEIDGLAHGQNQGLRQVGVEPHGDPVGGRFPARPLQVHVLAHDELERADQRSLHGRDVHFAVALARVAVAHFEQRARRVHRNETASCPPPGPCCRGCPRDLPAARCSDLPLGFIRRHSHAAEERVQRNFDIVGELRHIALHVERNDLGAALLENPSAAARPAAG